MELICRLMVMMLALLLCCTPKHRDAVLQRVRRVLKHEVDKMALSMQTALDQERPGVTLTPDGAPPHAIGWFGTWHVRTFNYRGDAMMALWLPPTHVPVGMEVRRGRAVASRRNLY